MLQPPQAPEHPKAAPPDHAQSPRPRAAATSYASDLPTHLSKMQAPTQKPEKTGSGLLCASRPRVSDCSVVRATNLSGSGPPSCWQCVGTRADVSSTPDPPLSP